MTTHQAASHAPPQHLFVGSAGGEPSVLHPPAETVQREGHGESAANMQSGKREMPMRKNAAVEHLDADHRGVCDYNIR